MAQYIFKTCSDKEDDAIIDKVMAEETNRSEYIRKAILFYIKYNETMKNIENKLSTVVEYIQNGTFSLQQDLPTEISSQNENEEETIEKEQEQKMLNISLDFCSNFIDVQK